MKAFLTHALNLEGNLVHVDAVPNGNDCGCVCPACGQPLQARNGGNLRAHHFAHQSGEDCPTALETTLHLLAKEKIQKAFYEHTTFNIEFEYHSYCAQDECCPFSRHEIHCETKTLQCFNLKEYYDTCEQEVAYDNIRRRSDLRIWSQAYPERKPIYIEIFVTHPSETKKLHSGNKIIEVKIENEQDIEDVVRKGFKESPHNVEKQFEDKKEQQKISFWGFKTIDYNNTEINTDIVFSRYILYPSGKSQCFQDSSLCKELQRTRKDALYEICFHTFGAFGIHELSKWMGYKKFGIKNCLVCKNYVESYDGLGKLCRLYKRLGLNRFDKHNTALAKTCKFFVLNEQEMDEYLSKLNNGWSPPMTEL